MRVHGLVACLAVLWCGLAGCAEDADHMQPSPYPESPRTDTADEIFGERVADPYRWLEDLEGAETAGWVQAQNEYSRPRLEALPARSGIESRLEELWDYERVGTPRKRGGHYFFFRNDGLQNQSVLYVSEDLDAEPRVLLDPNGFSEDGTVSLGSIVPSPDGKLLAYSVSDGGTDWKVWHVRDVDQGVDLEDEVRFTKFTGVSWLPDASGFYYSRYPLREDGYGDGSAQVSVHFHRLGSEQSDDAEVYALPEEPSHQPYATVTDDGAYLLFEINDGFDSNAIHVRRLDRPDAPTEKLLDEWDALYQFVGNRGSELYFYSSLDAPNWRLVKVDVDRPQRIVEVVPESEQRLEGIDWVGERFLARYLRDAHSVLAVFDERGERLRTVDLPGLGTVGGVSGEQDDPEAFFSFSSYTVPTEIYRYDVAADTVDRYWSPEVDVELADYVTEQVFYESRDGTRVPMFLTYRKGMERNGQNPTLLYGYGGFDISLTPGYDPERTIWLEMGGMFAVANLRGGGEYGEAWHRAGTKRNKQNVFDDFIAAAEYLIAEGYTSTPKLAIQGRSNGGLLVGATLTQRPDLFGAALPGVGVLDMLRYHMPSANARAWSSDYGLAENEEEFRALLAYSPLHNIAPGTCYPPTLVTTADRDDRVVPWHSFKFAAALQAAQSCDNPVLIRVETRAGHGAGTPTWMEIEHIADDYGFLAEALDIELPKSFGPEGKVSSDS